MAAEVKYTITSEDKSKAGVESSKRGMESIARGAADLKAAFDMVFSATERIFNTLKGTVTAYAESETAMAKLEQVLKTTGGTLGLTAGQLAGYAEHLQNLTGIDADLTVKNMAMMATFTQIGKNVFPEAIARAADMTDMFGSMEAATMQIGKALNSPIEGLGALSRVGVKFTEETKKTIEQLVELGRVEEAQKIILAELKNEFGGVAEAVGNTFSGSIRKIQATLGDIAETVGGVIAKSTKPFIDNINKFLVDHKTQITNTIQNLPQLFSITFEAIEKIIKRVFEPSNMADIFSEIGASFGRTVGAILKSIPTMVSEGVKILINSLKTLGPMLDAAIWNAILGGIGIKKKVEPAISKKEIDEQTAAINASLKIMVDTLQKNSAIALDGLNSVGNTVLSKTKDIIDQYITDVKSIIDQPLPTENIVNSLTAIGDAARQSLTGIELLNLALGKMPEPKIAPAIVNIPGISNEKEFGAGAAGGSLGGGISFFQPIAQPQGMASPTAGTGVYGGTIGGVLDTAMQSLSSFSGSIISAIASIDSIRMVFMPLQTILTATINYIKPVVNTVMAPLVGILTILGNTLGAIIVPVFKALEPVITFVAKAFALLYNYAIMPLANFIIGIINIIGMTVTAVMNAVIAAANLFLAKKDEIATIKMPGLYDNMLTEKIDITSITQAGAATIGGETAATLGGTSGGVAQYTGGKVVSITIHVNNPQIIGDDGIDKWAQLIANKIRLGEELTA